MKKQIYHTFPYPPFPKTLSNWKFSGPKRVFGGLTVDSFKSIFSIYGSSLNGKKNDNDKTLMQIKKGYFWKLNLKPTSKMNSAAVN